MDRQVEPTDARLEFLGGGGFMGERIRAYDWANSPLGDPRSWSQGLRTAVRLVLTTGHPTMILWGADLSCLYNDAFSRSLGPEKHPAILGAPGRQAWDDVWPLVGDEIERVLRGGAAVWRENQRVPIFRYGELQEAYWTYSYSPVDEPAAPHGVGGVLVTCSELTGHVLAQQKLAAERKRIQVPGADVTSQAVADRALELNRARLDYATRLSGVGFWYCDLPFDQLMWDERVKEHFFFAPTDTIGIDDFYARIHDDDRASTREAIETSIRTGKPYDIVYRTVHPATREIKWVRALGGTDYAADGTPTHFDGVTVDVSAQKLDQQRLAELNFQLCEHDRRKDEFIATLSHELRNPLAPIRAAARVISSPQLAPAQLKQAQVIIERQVAHMAMLLDDLLDIARITQAKLRLRKETLALVSVVDTAVEAVRPALDARNQRLSLKLPTAPVVFEADHLRLAQILSNLLMNAAKYSDPGSNIELAGAIHGDKLTLSVKDSGMGIAAESMQRIFDMFSQIEGAASRSEGGLGIGLALVKGLTELHGGSVHARSDGLGRGSEFIVHLPLAISGRHDPASLTGGRPSAPVRRRVLIADDNRDAAESLSMLLDLGGHDVRVVNLGREAVSLAREFRPETAVLDIGLPDLSGYEVARTLRREPWARGIQLIALTGWGQDEDRQRALEAGFDHHLIKPVDSDQLMEVLASASPGKNS